MAEAEKDETMETKMESSLSDKKDTSTVEIASDPPIEGEEEEDTDNATRRKPFQIVPIVNGKQGAREVEKGRKRDRKREKERGRKREKEKGGREG